MANDLPPGRLIIGLFEKETDPPRPPGIASVPSAMDLYMVHGPLVEPELALMYIRILEAKLLEHTVNTRLSKRTGTL